MIILKSKKAEFAPYQWFMLFMSVGLLTAAFLSLWDKVNDTDYSTLGMEASDVYEAMAVKESFLKELDFKAKIAAHRAFRKASNNFGVDGDGILAKEMGEIQGVPIMFINARSNPKIDAEGYFHKFFLEYLEEELLDFQWDFEGYIVRSKDGGAEFEFDEKSVSIYDHAIYGFSLIDYKVKDFDFDSHANTDHITLDFSANFKYQFSDFSIEDFVKVNELVRDKVYPLFNDPEFKTDECDYGDLQELFKFHNNGEYDSIVADYQTKIRNGLATQEDKQRYELFRDNRQYFQDNFLDYELAFNQDCIDMHSADDIHKEYHMEGRINFPGLENNECIVLLCIRDKTRMIAGVSGDDKYVVNYPSYKVGLSVVYDTALEIES